MYLPFKFLPESNQGRNYYFLFIYLFYFTAESFL